MSTTDEPCRCAGAQRRARSGCSGRVFRPMGRAVARALINNPALILADEPTGNLDLAAGTEIMRLLQTLHKEGRTIVLVTHDDAVAAYASREILLVDGVIVSDRSRNDSRARE